MHPCGDPSSKYSFSKSRFWRRPHTYHKNRTLSEAEENLGSQLQNNETEWLSKFHMSIIRSLLSIMRHVGSNVVDGCPASTKLNCSAHTSGRMCEKADPTGFRVLDYAIQNISGKCFYLRHFKVNNLVCIPSLIVEKWT